MALIVEADKFPAIDSQRIEFIINLKAFNFIFPFLHEPNGELAF